jgi:hypothetical protein
MVGDWKGRKSAPGGFGRIWEFSRVAEAERLVAAGCEVACSVGVWAVFRLWRKKEILENAIIGVWM